MSKPKTARDLVLEVKADAIRVSARCDEIVRQLNELGIDAAQARHLCPRCGIPGKSQRAIDEHVYWTHDGPEPAHFALIEARSNDLETTDEAPLRGARKAES